jgi:DNA-binding PadR family transcriptional regulator
LPARVQRPNDLEGVLPLTAAVFSILLSLASGERHGYAIMKEVSLADGGAISMGPGTLYGSLDRMMKRGLVEETNQTDDERRRYYRLTNLGRTVLGAEATRLHRAILSARRRGVLANGENA